MKEIEFSYGRKNGGVWHLVVSDSPRAMCDQWIVANQLSEERPDEARLCRRCFRLSHDEESRKARGERPVVENASEEVTFILGRTD